MTREKLFEQIQKKESFLCIGLDPDITKMPRHILEENIEYPLLEFNKKIIDATAKYAVAYKPNLAFYEVFGSSGWVQLECTVNYIKSHYPEILIIADAKRGDIKNTSKMYAKAFFEKLGADGMTIAPYMGIDSVGPFLTYKDKWSIILALTSNDGSTDLQTLHIEETTLPIYQHMLKKAVNEWGATPDNSMFVVGATKAEYFQPIRGIVPDHFLLVPGVGEQGGSLEDVAKYGINKQCGLLVNSSRGIIHASDTIYFTEVAAKKAKELQQQMRKILIEYDILE